MDTADTRTTNGRHGVPDTHVWNPETGRYLADGADPGALLKKRDGTPTWVNTPDRPSSAAEACRYPNLGADHPTGDGLECHKAGNLPACQLCPQSPTNWRNTPAPPVPADALPGGLPLDPGTDRWAGTLDWGKNGLSPAYAQRSRDGWMTWPCQACGQPTMMKTVKGVPMHKTCAERWYAEHPNVPLPPIASKRKGRASEGNGEAAPAVEEVSRISMGLLGLLDPEQEATE